MKKLWILLSLCCVMVWLSQEEHSTAKPLQVGINRWLAVSQIKGTVTYRRGNTTQKAQVGTKLQSVGDSITTGAKSSAVLSVDTGVGSINVSENATVTIEQLQLTPNGGRITKLRVVSGQARLQVRRFTNPNSSLEVQTPAGISGVRGTQFGVSVQPDGKTGVATLEGSVATSAQGKTVAVNSGFQSLVIPGEPPSPPVRLREDTRLSLRLLTATDARTARIAGQVDPVNLVLFLNKPIVIQRNGQFDVKVPLPANRRIEAAVITPLGKQQIYELAVP